MEGFLLMVLFAFLFYLVVLPLLGFLVGFICYYVLPYAFGGVVAIAVAVLVGIKLLLTWWFWVPALAWASAVYYMKKKFSDLGEEVEHHHAANALLLGGLPYKRCKNQAFEAVAADS